MAATEPGLGLGRAAADVPGDAAGFAAAGVLGARVAAGFAALDGGGLLEQATSPSRTGTISRTHTRPRATPEWRRLTPANMRTPENGEFVIAR